MKSTFAATRLWPQPMYCGVSWASRRDSITFQTLSGDLVAKRNHASLVELNFPATPPTAQELSADILEALGAKPCFTGMSRFDALVVLDSERDLRNLTPDFEALARADVRGVIATSRSLNAEFDFVFAVLCTGGRDQRRPCHGLGSLLPRSLLVRSLFPGWASQNVHARLPGFRPRRSGRSGIAGWARHSFRKRRYHRPRRTRTLPSCCMLAPGGVGSLFRYSHAEFWQI